MKKIIYISYSFEKGGAARASNNICDCLIKKKFNIKKYSYKNIIKNNFFSLIKILFFNLLFKTISKNKKKKSFNLFNISNLNQICENYNIVHLNWIGNEFLSLKEIIKIKKKIVWTVHDDWLKNVITHVGDEDSNNNFPISYFKKKIRNYKKKLFKKKITFIAPSNYILKNLRKKTKNKIYLIRHPIDEKIFNYKKKKKSNLITFNIGGSNVFQDQNKGSSHVDKILNLSKNYINIDYKFIFFGSKNYDNKFNKNKKIYLKNYLESKKISKIFSNSDYTFVLSKIESFSLITAESLMCGCPIVCFDDNAASELIIHKKNGFLLKRNDKNSIKNFLLWAKKNKNFFNRKKIAKEANKEFSYKSISKKYKKIYEDL